MHQLLKKEKVLVIYLKLFLLIYHISVLHMEILIVCFFFCLEFQQKSIICFFAITYIYMVFPINLPNNISFAFQLDDNVEAVPENNEIGASLTGQSDDLSSKRILNKGYA